MNGMPPLEGEHSLSFKLGKNPLPVYDIVQHERNERRHDPINCSCRDWGSCPKWMMFPKSISQATIHLRTTACWNPQQQPKVPQSSSTAFRINWNAWDFFFSGALGQMSTGPGGWPLFRREGKTSNQDIRGPQSVGIPRSRGTHLPWKGDVCLSEVRLTTSENKHPRYTSNSSQVSKVIQGDSRCLAYWISKKRPRFQQANPWKPQDLPLDGRPAIAPQDLLSSKIWWLHGAGTVISSTKKQTDTIEEVIISRTIHLMCPNFYSCRPTRDTPNLNIINLGTKSRPQPL